jgi:hypothetical protein
LYFRYIRNLTLLSSFFNSLSRLICAGIIMGNYVARSGADCALDAAVAISGGLDMRYETDFYRAQRLWQPLLTETLRNDFVIGKWGERVRERL